MTGRDLTITGRDVTTARHVASASRDPSAQPRSRTVTVRDREVAGDDLVRIAYVCSDPGVPVLGAKGASVHVRELTRALVEVGHAVRVFAARAGGDPPEGYEVPVSALDRGLEAVPGRVPRPDRRAAARDLSALAAARRLAAAAGRHVEDFAPDAVYERYALFGTAGLRLARRTGRGLLLEVNAPLRREQARHRGLALGETAAAVDRLVLRAADRLLAVSDAVRDWLESEGVDPDRIVVVPNAVDPAAFAPAGDGGTVAASAAGARARLGLGPEPAVGFVGGLRRWHGTRGLLDAAEILGRRGRRLQVVVVGDGPERAVLEARAATIGVPVVFTGAVPHAEVPRYLAALDVAVAPYDDAGDVYFSPLKLFEYLAAGRPVVAADAGQMRSVIRHGETGLLYAPGVARDLAAAIAAVLDDAGLAGALAEAGRSHVARHHTWHGNARTVASLAAEVARERSRPRSSADGPGHLPGGHAGVTAASGHRRGEVPS